MAVVLKEACAWCGKAMTDAEIGDYWYHSERKPGFKCLCELCARTYCFFEPSGLVVSRTQVGTTAQLTLL